MSESAGLSYGILIFIVFGFFLLIFFAKGIKLIRDNEVGVPTRKMFGRRMPPGQVIARRDETGVQARTLMPGLYWFFPGIWKISKVPVTIIGDNQVGVVESVDGDPIITGRLLGDEVECNSYQDAVAFLFPPQGGKRGNKGPQVAILRPGTYRINTKVFTVTPKQVTLVNEERIGVVVALDGKPLPPGYIIAPKPEEPKPGEELTKKSHNFYQDGQAFIDSKGYRGPQLDSLQPGNYYINPLLFEVMEKEITEVPPGYVAVLRSNIGKELVRDVTKPTELDKEVDLAQEVHEKEEVVLTTDKNERGIWREPVAPGKYNLNPLAFTFYLVPTSAVTIDWASSAKIRTEEHPVDIKQAMSQKRPIAEEIGAGKAIEFFKFSQLTVTSKDGFQLEVDVRMIIRIRPQHASFVIARFGSVENLIEQIVHPLIDASFRNNAGEKKAIEFVWARSELQKDALDKAREEFEKYHVEAQGLLIAYIKVDVGLLKTQTDREIATQQIEMYMKQKEAQDKRVEMEKATGIAERQKELAKSEVDIKIKENFAKARENEGKGEASYIKQTGEAAGAKVLAIGLAKAESYAKQVDALGKNQTAIVNAITALSENGLKFVPNNLVINTGGSGGGSGTMDGALLTLMNYLSTLGKPETEAKPEPKKEVTVEKEEVKTEEKPSDKPDEMQQ